MIWKGETRKQRNKRLLSDEENFSNSKITIDKNDHST